MPVTAARPSHAHHVPTGWTPPAPTDSAATAATASGERDSFAAASPQPAAPPETVGPVGELSAADAQERFRALQSWVNEFAEELELDRVPRVRLDDRITGVGFYDEVHTRDIFVKRELLTWDGGRARKILAHEMEHAWQHESKLFAYNFKDTGVYVDAPDGPMWKTLINPLKLARLVGYALQPVELHAELTRMVRTATGMLPDDPW